MPLYSSSKTGLKRSSRAAALAACLLLFSPLPVFPEHLLEIFSNTIDHGPGPEIEIRTLNIPRGRIESSLKSGHSAEIRYHIRVFRPRTGPLSIIGDALEAEHTTVFTGMWNPVLEAYTLVGNGERRFFTDYTSFVEAFSTISLPSSLYPELRDSRYAHAKVTLIPEVPVPPFTLLAPFLPNLRVSSPWRRVAEVGE